VKAPFFISLIALLTSNLTAQTWNKNAIELLYDKIIHEYGTNEIKTIYTTQKKFPYTHWIENTNDHNSIIISLRTVIHEMQHGMDDFNENAGEKGAYQYYLNDSCVVEVPQTLFFTSDQLNNYIPASVSDSIFRYGIYVGKKDEIGGYKKKFNINSGNSISYSIHHGIFGLMEEFLAYYRGLQVLAQIYPYFLNYLNTHNFSEEEKKSQLGDYKYYVYQEVNSFYEFQLFIAWYLQYAKKEKTEIYRQLYENKPLRYLFGYIHQSYLNLIEGFVIQLDTISMYHSDYNFLYYIKLDDTEEDFCKFLYYSDFAGDEYKKILIEGNENHLGEKSFRFIGDREERRFFKKYYNQVKKEVFRKFKDLASARFMIYLADQQAQLQFLKRQTTHEVIQEISNFKSLNHHERFCKTNQ
jgi:hypothetical protein